MTQIAGIPVETRINLANVVGFLIMFAGIVASWTSLQGKTDQLTAWQAGHERVHADTDMNRRAQFARIDEKIAGNEERINKHQSDLDQFTYRTAQLEKAIEEINARLTRMSENYSNQFTEMRSQLNTISTQVALVNQALSRLEAGTNGGARRPSSP